MREQITSVLLPCRVGFYPRGAQRKLSAPAGERMFIILLCLDGAGVLEVANAKYRLTQGEFAFLRPGEPYTCEAEGHRPWPFYAIHFNGAMAQQYYEALTSGGLRQCRNIGINARILQAFDRILSSYHEGHAHRLLVQGSAALHQLLAEVYSSLYSRHAESESSSSRIRRVVQVLHDNVGSQLSIEELAAAANMSHPSFLNNFRKHTGENPRTYFNKLKIRRACELLRRTDLKIETIAQMVGFDDPFYFSRAFKRTTGVAPSEFRLSEQVDPAPLPSDLESPASRLRGE